MISVTPRLALEALPNELLEDILEDTIINSKTSNFTALCLTDMRYQKICLNDNFWKKLYYKYYGDSNMINVVNFTSYYDLH